MSPMESTICTQGGSHAALQAETVCWLAVSHRRLSINHIYEELWPFWLGLRKGIDSLGPTAVHVAAFSFSLFRDYGLVPQALKDGVSAEPHQQGGDGAGQNYL